MEHLTTETYRRFNVEGASFLLHQLPTTFNKELCGRKGTGGFILCSKLLVGYEMSGLGLELTKASYVKCIIKRVFMLVVLFVSINFRR